MSERDDDKEDIMTTTQDARTEDGHDRTDGPVHTWFSLSYANFLVWHRAHLQSMPLEWQRRFVDLAEELDAAYPDGTGTDYEVATVRREYAGDLTEAEMKQIGIEPASDDEDEDNRDARQQEYYDSRTGRTLQGYDYVGIPVPDPVPHYNRGRTYLPPDEASIAAHRAFRAEYPLEAS